MKLVDVGLAVIVLVSSFALFNRYQNISALNHAADAKKNSSVIGQQMPSEDGFKEGIDAINENFCEVMPGIYI